MFFCRNRWLWRNAVANQLLHQHQHASSEILKAGGHQQWENAVNMARQRLDAMRAASHHASNLNFESTHFATPNRSEIWQKIHDFPHHNMDPQKISSSTSWLDRWNAHASRHAAIRAAVLQPSTMPKVDLMETNLSYIIEAEIPAFARERLKLETHNNHTLILEYTAEAEPSAQKASSASASTTASEATATEEATQTPQYIFKERTEAPPQSSFKRVFQFAQAVDGKGVKAHFDNGILKVTLPKQVSIERIQIAESA